MSATSQDARRIARRACVPDPAVDTHRRLRLLSYNIQAGIGSSRYHHYLTHSWKHLLPHGRGLANLDRIAHVIDGYDLVALQETDAGSLRSNFVNQTEYLAHRCEFPFHHYQVNRNMGRFAQHSNSLLSRIRPNEVIEYKLPGLIPGRGALMARFGPKERSLVLFIIHLALSRRARLEQLAYLADLVNAHDHVVLMGDMNCQANSPEMRFLFGKTDLCEPIEELGTFPSWRPVRNIDHILVTPTLEVHTAQVLSHAFSDHLPVAMEIALPDAVHMTG